MPSGVPLSPGGDTAMSDAGQPAEYADDEDGDDADSLFTHDTHSSQQPSTIYDIDIDDFDDAGSIRSWYYSQQQQQQGIRYPSRYRDEFELGTRGWDATETVKRLITGKSSGSHRLRPADDAEATAAGSKRPLEAAETGGDASAPHKKRSAVAQVRGSTTGSLYQLLLSSSCAYLCTPS
jgi:hypothetical protein